MKTKDGESKVDMKVKVNFVGYESVQSENGIGGTNNRWDYAQSYGEMIGMMQKNVERMGDLAQDKLKLMRNAAGISANPGYEKETDVHYWVTDGQGIFNHRMIWPMKYNLDNLVDRQMRLQVKVYDWDVGKDDLLGETQLNIDDCLRDAFKNRERNRFIQVGEPWRLAEGALRDWKIPVDLKKDGVSVGTILLSIAVYDHMVALLKPAGEARAEPNQNPQLPEPLRRMPWDEAPLATSSLGCCGGLCGGQPAGGGNMAA